uniref:Complement factor H isoform X2 n=1 Tax=Geotrypetes seraphini TaxID=260995 RepID=A0A6P8SHH1_GEOSA|nr:complement factor H isoform X2 [Geotrypetes seraphini]
MAFLKYIVLLMLWSFCSAQECGPPISIPTAELIGEWDKASYPSGTEATYQCRPGYIKVGRIIYQCVDGIWKVLHPRVACKNKPCGHPGDLPYGSFDLTRGSEFVFGARVEYQCDDGYHMVSRLNYRECTAIGWNNYVPHCEVIKCLPVQPPQNGRIVMTGMYDVDEEYPYGHILRFECDSPIHKLSGPNEIYCLKTGEWSADVPSCEVISCQEPSISNGKILSRLQKKQYENRERIQYECNSGYKHESRGYSECTENGWNPAPSCIEIVCNFQSVVNGNLQPEKNVYRENERVKLVCNQGYQPEYREESPICTRTGWNPPLLCVHKDCGFPTIENGRLYWTTYSTYKDYYFPMRKGQKIDYTCNEGFLTEEGNIWGRIKCTDEGWFPIPKCTKTCEQFRVVNGYLTSSATNYHIGDKAIYNCLKGYSTPEGMASGEIECLKSGWSTEPKCIKTCTKPLLRNGHYSHKPVFMAGDILQYECNEGYMTSERNLIERLMCTETGWKGYPECTAITCPVDDDEIANGSSTPQSQEYRGGHVLKYFCNENYVLKGEELRQCYYFGWFPKTLLQCKEITCTMTERKGALFSPSLQTYKNLDTVKISCDEGYKINGSELIQCYYFGWYPKPPTCKVKKPKLPTDSADRDSTNEDQDTSVSGQVEKCPPAPQLPNAETVPNKDYYKGDKVKYICKENYHLQGKAEIECKNEKWTSPPRCIESTEKCPRPPSLSNMVVQDLQKQFYENDTVHFNCHEKFKLHGSETIQCIKGSWTMPPQCIEEQLCNQPPNIKNGKVATPPKLRYSEDDTVTYNCNSGFHTEEPNEITCTGGKWSAPPQCKGDSCGIPPEVENGFIQNKKSSYDHGDKIYYKCNPGFNLDGNSEVKCSEGTWSVLPQCLDTSCGIPPSIENAEIISTNKERYISGDKVDYECIRGFILHEGVLQSTCQNREWSKVPVCTKALPTCNQPPSIFNGATEGSQLREYKSGQKVAYRCISYYIMDGSPTVTCQQGRWSDPPTCFEPCTASDYEMEANNIVLKWKDDNKLYVLHGEQVEFACKYNHVILAPSQKLRVTCIRGHLEYPKCIKSGSCVVSFVELVKNNLELGKENTEVRHETSIVFKCKLGFSPEQSQKMEESCNNKRLTYPKCISNTPNRSCGPPPIIENGDISSTLIPDYAHGSSVRYQCSRNYELRDPKPVVCNDGEWSSPSECVG